jgi:hypothetical protein
VYGFWDATDGSLELFELLKEQKEKTRFKKIKKSHFLF